jgi:hypothetical protein
MPAGSRSLSTGRPAPLRLPPHIRSQLDALSARVAWMHVGAPLGLLLRGEAHSECPPITTASDEEFGRLCIS